MNILEKFREYLPTLADLPGHSIQPSTTMPVITAVVERTGVSRIIYTHTFNGEKDAGEIGPIRSYYLDYAALRMRSWQAMLENEIAQIVIYKYATWVIGTGLKFNAEPSRLVLESEGINGMDFEKWTKLVEARFEIYSGNGRMCDFARMWKRSKISKRAFINSLIGGDCLVVLRYENGYPTIQLIDGAHIQSPAYGNELYGFAKENGNTIKHGIEIAPNGQHVAYYVLRDGAYNQFDRIPAYGPKSGIKMAFMVYGLEYRLDNVRGLPLLSVILEGAAKLGRYKEATLGSAEERQKIVYTVKHKLGSTGENPAAQQIVRAININAEDPAELPIDAVGNYLANKIQATTNKQTWNLPINSELEAVDSKNELYFKDFYEINFDILCATIGIPPNVALSKYNDSFSASRAALKDWEHKLLVTRDDHSYQFEQPIYEFFLDIEILKGKIQAPGYLVARLERNEMVLGAYRKCRWIGANVPHIDPLKEVMAERAKLGATGASLPLTTLQAATEALGNGEADSNLDQYAREKDKAEELGIEILELNEPEPEPEPPTKDGDK